MSSRNSRARKLCCPTRRQALSMIGSTMVAPFLVNPLENLVSSLVNGMVMNARAQAIPRNYVLVGMFQAPPRWHFDLPLNPSGLAGQDIDPSVINRIKGINPSTGKLEMIHESAPITVGGVTLHMPPIWKSKIPVHGGGWTDMSRLLEHMLMIRGINMKADGHANDSALQVRPVPSAPSLGGLVADASSLPLPAVGMSGVSGFYHARKATQVVTYSANPNPLANLLGPFITKSGESSLLPTYVDRRAAMDQAVRMGLSKLADFSRSRTISSEQLDYARSNAETLLRKGITGLDASFTETRDKYLSLIKRCADWENSSTPAIVGITDQPIEASRVPDARMLSAPVAAFGGADVRSLVGVNSSIPGLAESLAVAEYLIVNNYSCSILTGMSGTLEGMNHATSRWTFDEHSPAGGILPSLVANAFLYRSLAACLNHFIEALVKAGKFDETVIHLGAEFGRTPGMSGSEHGWMAQNISVFSGAIKKPMVLGNVVKSANFGAAAPVKIDGFNQELVLGNQANTLAHLLRVEPLFSNNSSLVHEDASTGTVTATIEDAKNV